MRKMVSDLCLLLSSCDATVRLANDGGLNDFIETYLVLHQVSFDLADPAAIWADMVDNKANTLVIGDDETNDMLVMEDIPLDNIVAYRRVGDLMKFTNAGFAIQQGTN